MTVSGASMDEADGFQRFVRIFVHLYWSEIDQGSTLTVLPCQIKAAIPK